MRFTLWIEASDPDDAELQAQSIAVAVLTIGASAHNGMSVTTVAEPTLDMPGTWLVQVSVG